MLPITEKNYYQDDGLVAPAFGNRQLNEINGFQSPTFLGRKQENELRQRLDFCITRAAMNCGLYFRVAQEFALVSGAGPVGLAIAIELRARNFKVIIAEKRKDFSRTNVINLNIEIQLFLKKYGLLKEFEDSVAARIKQHRIVHVGKKGIEDIAISDVSQLKLKDTALELENFDKLFKEDGIYSVQIKELQTFLAEKALAMGVQILGGVQVIDLPDPKTKDVSNLQIKAHGSLCDPTIPQPHLFFAAEGAHSQTAKRLGMEMNELINECSGEHWIYGNVDYAGKENFVVSIIDTTEESLKIANVIFNAMIHKINIAVTSPAQLSEKQINEQILKTAHLALRLENINETPASLYGVVKKPVQVKNAMLKFFSKGISYGVGETAGRSSPLAGLGGTLSLTLIPLTIQQLLNDREMQPHKMHHNFAIHSKAYISKWVEKSCEVKRFCLSLFNKEMQSHGTELKGCQDET